MGLANQFMTAPGIGASGVDWGQVLKVGYALLLSPLVGFVGSAGMLMLMKLIVRNKRDVRGARHQPSAAAMDSRIAGADLHRRLVRPWQQ